MTDNILEDMEVEWRMRHPVIPKPGQVPWLLWAVQMREKFPAETAWMDDADLLDQYILQRKSDEAAWAKAFTEDGNAC